MIRDVVARVSPPPKKQQMNEWRGGKSSSEQVSSDDHQMSVAGGVRYPGSMFGVGGG